MTCMRLQKYGPLSVAIISLFAVSGTPAHAQNPAAHTLADKFAEADKAAAEKKKRKAQEAQRAKERTAEAARHEAEEAEMLARARREAAEREEAVRKAEAALKEAKRIVREAEALRRAEEEERQIEEARRKDEARRAEEARVAEAERVAREAEAQRQEMARREERERIAREKEAQNAAEKVHQERAEASRLNELAAQREAESRRLSEKLKRIHESRPPVGMALGGDPDRMDSATAITAARPAPSARARKKNGKRSSNKVTVLLVMEPGTNGIRRGNKTADPVLCLKSGCYVSRGPSRAAKWLPRHKALGPINTISVRAGACRRSLVCVFRNVNLAKGKIIQPIDLRYVRHDRREPAKIRADQTCNLDGNRLTCLQRAEADGWQAWIVPEPLAKKASPEALMNALSRLTNPLVGATYHGPVDR